METTLLPEGGPLEADSLVGSSWRARKVGQSARREIQPWRWVCSISLRTTRAKTAQTAWAAQTPSQTPPPHNVVIFIADGLRARSVNDETAPNMAALAREGVTLANGHSIFPTFTTANASAMATGHFLGDTGDFSNTIYTAWPVPAAGGTVTPFLENDAVLGEVDAHFGGDYLDEMTVLALARAKGYATAAIGKVGPVLMFDHTERTGRGTIIIDDATGSAAGVEGVSNSTGGYGVFGIGTDIGVYGVSAAASTTGSGVTRAGVWGDTGGASGQGYVAVVGTADDNSAGEFENNGTYAALLVKNHGTGRAIDAENATGTAIVGGNGTISSEANGRA